ncbi:MAG TPA: glycoside hydrolase family 3 N-terminal domain-containing protein [Victivallales bacterium]|nr:glycoside hydrolase family 3 N-terminal domain-containing protein [Victivallales bacterium]
MFNKPIFILLSLLLPFTLLSENKGAVMNKYDSKIKALMKKMTLNEKVGQLAQYSGKNVTGTSVAHKADLELIREGKVGSFLNITGYANTMKLQETAVKESRLGIPLLFGLDVIHGYKTIFPVPLAQSCTWDINMLTKAQKIAADEASASGVNWVFSPMVNVSRDPRWGRVVEGFGEDTYLTTLMAVAFIKGFHGESLSEKNTVLSCIKHYVAYALVQAGREYWTVDVSNRTLWETYMPSYKAAVDAGVGSIMPSFTGVDSIPMTANKYLINDILKDKWGFNGIVVSDWNAIDELINHGVAGNKYQAGKLAIDAGVTMDMVSGIYNEEIPKLLKDKKISVEQLDKLVYEVLSKKFELGLFDNPYLYNDKTREKATVYSEINRQYSRKVAQKSIVLLKNTNNILPLKKNISNIAVIGPLAADKGNPLGPWSAKGMHNSAVSVLEGIKNAVSSNTNVYYAKGCNIKGDDKTMIEDAVNTAKRADIVIAVVGEEAVMSGEAASRAFIDLPGVQKELLQKLYDTGIPVIAVLMNGRPLTINWTKEYIPAILETWFLGSEAGNAIADVIFGDYNPSGKLTMTFPYAVGQIPIYYNTKRSGRPETLKTKHDKYVSKYIDIPNAPLYHFGYGLSYTTFEYSEISLSKNKIKSNESINATVEITNTGKFAGTETVQLYTHDEVASVTVPVKEMKGFKQIYLKPGETQKVTFTIMPDDLKIYNYKMEKVLEPGYFDVFIGGSSATKNRNNFEIIK